MVRVQKACACTCMSVLHYLIIKVIRENRTAATIFISELYISTWKDQNCILKIASLVKQFTAVSGRMIIKLINYK